MCMSITIETESVCEYREKRVCIKRERERECVCVERERKIECREIERQCVNR